MGTRKKNTQIAVVLIFLAAVVALSTPLAQEPASRQVPAGANADWRPNDPAKGVQFVGSRVCAECHEAKATSQQKTSMGRAMSSGDACEILRTHTKLTYNNGKFQYQIKRDGSRSMFTVTNGTETISVPIPWCFGRAEAGQTYVLQYKDKFYEGRVSFFTDIQGLDLTMGHRPEPPATLEAALGREMAMPETRQCFGCHTTNSLDGSTLQLDRLMEGVTCEACHGPGEKHVAAMKRGDLGQKNIFNPSRLSTEDLSNFCGACHRTWEQVALMKLRGVANVRFQPYRLTNSKCYDSEDNRISCLGCHDPHEGRRHDSAFYDSKCAACHHAQKPSATPAVQPATRRAPLCPVGKARCASCHMPKYEIPTSHLTFSDHHIRVVRPAEPYPN